MANRQALILVGGRTERIPAADTLVVGAGVATSAGNLTITPASGAASVAGNLLVVPTAAFDTGVGVVAGVAIQSPSLTGQPASTEIADILFNPVQPTLQYATGDLVNQRTIFIGNQKYSFVGASLITGVAATVEIAGPPVAHTNAAVNKAAGLWTKTTSVVGAGSVSKAYGHLVEAPTGASNNFALGLTGDAEVTGNTFSQNVSVENFLNLVSSSISLVAGNNNNKAITSSYVRISTAAATAALTGMAATPSGTGAVVVLSNNSLNAVTLKDADAGSSAANRFDFSGGGDVTLSIGFKITLIYDPSAGTGLGSWVRLTDPTN